MVSWSISRTHNPALLLQHHFQCCCFIILCVNKGDYAPYREDLITHFEPTNDGQVHCDEDDARVASLFRSSDRQKIIDFVIGSRIRDSGAELGPSSQLGKQIKARVPLHSHARLEALYGCWVTFWRVANWNDRDGKSLRVEPETPRSEKSEDDEVDPNKPVSFAHFQQQKHLPNILYRFFVGSFYQPLDSIEEYYGEKIAFYFAWLQHVSFHLLYLSIIGSIVFWIQLSSGQWDHPIRPVSLRNYVLPLLLGFYLSTNINSFYSQNIVTVVLDSSCNLVIHCCSVMEKTIQLSCLQMGYS